MKRNEGTPIMVERLRDFHRTDNQERIRANLLRWVEDPLKPRTNSGGLRIDPILALFAALAVLAGSTFAFFWLVRP
jgi:hypothetical protein